MKNIAIKMDMKHHAYKIKTTIRASPLAVLLDALLSMTGGSMKTMERFAGLLGQGDVEAWRDQVFQFGANLGYRHASLAIFPSHDTPLEAETAFLHSSLPEAFICKYDEAKMGEIDPVVSHCLSRTTPIIWSSATFTTGRQRQLYEEACGVGACSGIALPHHGPNGEFGILCYASDNGYDQQAQQHAIRNIPELACFRDHVMEVFSGLMRKMPASSQGNTIELTARELECIKWCASGKSSWDIAQLMNCTEATVNYHFANIRRKFGASSRRMAVIKAIRLGFIAL